MGVNCAGEHECDPEFYPTSINDTWTCPECGRGFTAKPVTAMRVPDAVRHKVKPGQLGWHSAPLVDAGRGRPGQQ